MSYSNISASLTDAQKADIKTKIDDILAVLTFLINLTPDERKSLVKMGDKSVSFCKEANVAANNHSAHLPASFDLTEFNKDEKLSEDLLELFDYLRPLYEGIADTMMAVGNERMRQSIAVYNLLKEAAKTNGSLNSVVADLGERFNRAGRTLPSTVAIAPAGVNTIAGVVPNRLLKNVGSATLDIYKGPEKAGQKITVGGNQQVKIPNGWTQITIVNTDPANVGIASVIVK